MHIIFTSGSSDAGVQTRTILSLFATGPKAAASAAGGALAPRGGNTQVWGSVLVDMVDAELSTAKLQRYVRTATTAKEHNRKHSRPEKENAASQGRGEEVH